VAELGLSQGDKSSRNRCKRACVPSSIGIQRGDISFSQQWNPTSHANASFFVGSRQPWDRGHVRTPCSVPNRGIPLLMTKRPETGECHAHHESIAFIGNASQLAYPHAGRLREFTNLLAAVTVSGRQATQLYEINNASRYKPVLRK
jgi:hypothetical protein